LNSEYFARLMREEKLDIIAVQETHAVSEENLRKKATMPDQCDHVFIGGIYSCVHGIATYVEDSFSDCRVLYHHHSYDVYLADKEIDGIVILNVYKPLNANWPNNPLKSFPPSSYLQLRAILIHKISCEAKNK
jgi:exonuclease III